MKGLFHLLKRKWQRKKPLPYSIMPPVELFDSIKTLVKDTWDEIHETGNVFLLTKAQTEQSRKLFNYCSDTWDSIRDQHIKKFKLSFEYLQYLSKEAEVAELKIKYAISQDNWDRFLLGLAEDELAALKPSSEHDPTKEAAMLELALKKDNIDTSKISVDKYYTLLNMHNKLVANGR